MTEEKPIGDMTLNEIKNNISKEVKKTARTAEQTVAKTADSVKKTYKKAEKEFKKTAKQVKLHGALRVADLARKIEKKAKAMAASESKQRKSGKVKTAKAQRRMKKKI
ncbi:hypothetical protein JW933_01990 [candidate division FCPU426 bacterium]|nr:hypothetical protein [candidate division FCPU426 bacterium]